MREQGMTIAFDGQPLLAGEKTGIAWYAYNILMNLPVEKGMEYRLNIFGDQETAGKSEAVRKLHERGFAVRTNPFPGKAYKAASTALPLPYRKFFGDDTDVTVFFNYVVPPGVAGKSIAFVHDMSYRAYPETVRLRTRLHLDIALEMSCRRADRIATISEFSKKEIMKYLGVDGEKISVVPGGVDMERFSPGIPDAETERVRAVYGLTGRDGEGVPYILYLGTVEPRKNLIRLVRVYAGLTEGLLGCPVLALAGRDGWGYGAVHREAERTRLGERIRFLGYVPDEDRPALLKGAEAFVFPSLYEGFGLPPLEAMACGTPVLVSNAASLPEVAGDAALLADPLDENAIKDGLHRLCTDEALRKSLSGKGRERALQYTWMSATRKLEQVIVLMQGKHVVCTKKTDCRRIGI